MEQDLSLNNMMAATLLSSKAINEGKTLPKSLFRYRSCESEYFSDEIERLFKGNEIFYPSRVQLNDPFDCLPVIEKGMNFKEFSEKLIPLKAFLIDRSNKEFVKQGKLDSGDRKKLKKIFRNILITI